jgi:hypothetical protein
MARAVSGMERLWLAAGRVAPPFAVHAVVELDAVPDEGALAAAIGALHAAWPGLSPRLRGALRGARWAPAPAPALALCPAPGWAEGDISAAVAALDAAAALDPDGPSLRWLLLPGPPARLVLSTLHAITDGRGALTMLAALAGLLRGQAPPPLPPQRHEGDEALARGGRPVPPPPADAAAPFAPDGDPADRGRRTVRRRVAPAPRAPLARALAAAARARPGARLRVDVPVDLRSPAHGLQTGNLSGLLRVELPEAAGGPDGAAAVDAALRAALDAGAHLHTTAEAQRVRAWPLWLVAAEAGRRAAAERARGAVPVSFTFSNLGRVPLRTLDMGTARCTSFYPIPPAAPGLPALCTLTGGDDGAGGVHLELLVSAPARWAQAGTLLAWVDALGAALEAPA